MLPVHPSLFRESADGEVRLLGGRCRECDRRHFPQSEICPYCGAGGCEPAELGPRGSLWLYTAVLRPPPGYRGTVPFGFGIVELDLGSTPGLRVVTRLTEADPSKLRRGQPMRLVVEPLHADEQGRQVCTYAFAPEEAA